MMRPTIYIVVPWAKPHRPGSGQTREYGAARTKQAAIRLAKRVLPPDTKYIVTTVHRTVHEGRTPVAQSIIDQTCSQIRRAR